MYCTSSCQCSESLTEKLNLKEFSCNFPPQSCFHHLRKLVPWCPSHLFTIQAFSHQNQVSTEYNSVKTALKTWPYSGNLYQLDIKPHDLVRNSWPKASMTMSMRGSSHNLEGLLMPGELAFIYNAFENMQLRSKPLNSSSVGKSLK